MPARTVVVGVDFSESSLAAARWTARHLTDDAVLVLAHVICVPEPPRFLRQLQPPTEPVIDNARLGAESRMRELSRSIAAAGARTAIRVGHRPDEELARVAEELGAELLVVGPHGERPGLWKLLGSTAERTVRRGPGSVLLARALPPDGLRTILVALDESEVTPAVLAWTRWLADRFRARVVAMHVVHRLLAGAVAVAASESERRRAEGQLRSQAETWLEQQLAGAELQGASIEAAHGDAGLEILAAVERHHADLLVIGRHGARPASGMFLGSVAEFLLRNGTAAVLVVASSPPRGR